MRSFRTLLVALAVAVPGLAISTPAQAQDVEGCDKIEGLIAAGDYPAALVEIGWCERSVSGLHYDRILGLSGVEILGLQPGEGTAEAVMGFSTIDITHSGGGKEVRTTFASGLGGADPPMAGLGALASLGSAFGVQQPGVQQVRLGCNTGQLEEQSEGVYSLMVTLPGGQILTVEGADGDFLQEFATLTIDILQDYLAG